VRAYFTETGDDGPTRMVTGKLVSLGAKTIEIKGTDRAAPWVIDRENLLRLQRSVRGDAAKGAAIGLAAGAVAGLVLGSMLGDDGLATSGMWLGLALYGPPTGAVVGAFAASRPRWETVSPDAMRDAARHPPAALSLTVRF